jgi:L-ascorbate metabolism protein UlaG (beta-lactamase superfamily)
MTRFFCSLPFDDNIDEIHQTFKCLIVLSCTRRIRTIIAVMALKITFINHATLLVQMDGINVLTDPIYSRTVSFAFPRRQKPGIPLDELPPIDYILVSHSDYDHLNLKTLRMLRRKGPSAIVIPSGLALYARKSGFETIVELNTWESTERPGLTITCTPAKHHSKRTAWDHTGSACCGFVIQSRNYAVFFAGDTGYADFFQEIGSRFSIDAALLPIGAYKPEKWFKNVHLHPATAVKAFLDLKARHLIPYHWGTFWISDEPMAEPPQLLLAEAERYQLRDRVHVLNNGESVQF